jgi:hypothetical protein
LVFRLTIMPVFSLLMAVSYGPIRGLRAARPARHTYYTPSAPGCKGV